MKYIILLILLISITAKADKKKSEVKKQLISQDVCQEKRALTILQKLSLLNGKLMLDLPYGFELMSEEMLAAKYPDSNRPTLVYTNENGTVNFAFNHTGNKIPKGKLPELLPAFVKQFNAIYPQIEWFNKDVQKINGKDFIVLEFISPATDSKIYNIMYVTVLDGRMLMCSFNCLKSQNGEWETKAKESLNSVIVND